MMTDIDTAFQTEVQALFEKYNILLQEAGKEINNLKTELLQCKEKEKRLTAILIQKKKRAASQPLTAQPRTTVNESQRLRKRNIYDEQEHHLQPPKKQGLFSKLNNYGYC